MKNANIFVDVDLTLVDANRVLLAGATEALTALKAKGCPLFLWSTNGADYARKTADLHQLTSLFKIERYKFRFYSPDAVERRTCM